MKKILLINTLFNMKEKNSGHSQPYALFAIATPLVNNGYKVVMIDPIWDDAYEERIKDEIDEGVLFVGMTIFMGSNVANAVRITKFIKKISKDTPVVWGGALATSSPDLCFSGAPVDYIVMGMGEDTVVKLADRLRDGAPAAETPHVSSNINNKMILKDKYFFQDSLDKMEYAQVQLGEKGIKKDGSIPMLSSRGCPRNCAYCYNNTFVGRKAWYSRSAESVLAEMDHWAKYFNLNSFYFVDDNFLVNSKRACSILETSIKRKYEIKAIQGHLHDYTPDIVKLIPGNFQKVLFSIESSSPKIQKLINKPINVQKALDLFKHLTSKGVPEMVTNFMFGFPTETDEDILSNINTALTIRNINNRIRMVPHIYTPQRGDDIINSCKEYADKIRFSLDNLATCDTVPNRSKFISSELRPWMSKDDIQFYIDLVLVWFYNFDHVVREDQHIDVKSILAQNKRLANLFKGVSLP